MDQLNHYREVVKQILTEYHNLNLKSDSEIESALVFDEPHDHYLLLLMGWQKADRIKTVMIHIRLHNNKIWIEEDWTEAGVATDLLEAGIAPSAIVLAFHPPQLRQYTEFAIA